MPSKGPSNRYEHTRGAQLREEKLKEREQKRRPLYKWAKGFNKRTLNEHFKNHAADFGIGSEREYERRAVAFANTIIQGCEIYHDIHGSTYKFDRPTSRLVIVDSKGYVITFYKVKRSFCYTDTEGKKTCVKR